MDALEGVGKFEGQHAKVIVRHGHGKGNLIEFFPASGPVTTKLGLGGRRSQTVGEHVATGPRGNCLGHTAASIEGVRTSCRPVQQQFVGATG